MVSHEVAKASLSRILSKSTSDEGNEELLESFHLVAWYNDTDDSIINHHNHLIEPQLLYMCLGREHIILMSLATLKQKVIGITNENEMEPPMIDERFDTIKFPYTCITMIQVHARAEDRFGLVFDSNHPDCPHSLAPIMHLSSVYRKEVVSSIQMQHDSYMIANKGRLSELRIEFVGADSSDPRMAFRHPAVKMFSKLPVELAKDRDGRPKKVFFRRGYMFLLPRHVVDTYELMSERPSSTYVFRPLDASRKGGAQYTNDIRTDRAQHLLVQFLPEKPLRVDRRDSELEFELWTECIAYAVAEEQFQKYRDSGPYDPRKYHDTYFIPNSGVHRKKLNVVGDDTKWHCFRLHIRTKFREIGVIGVRRMFLPPRIDTLQDMIFIMYGPLQAETDEFQIDPHFMQTLDEMVDSLSPASAALQSRTRTSASMAGRALHLRSHPTFYDRLLIQARANALFFNRDAYAWLKFKEELKIVPRTLFIDMECSMLAAIFCKSLFKLFPKLHSTVNRTGDDNNNSGVAAAGGSGGGGGDDDNNNDGNNSNNNDNVDATNDIMNNIMSGGNMNDDDGGAHMSGYDREPDDDVNAVADPLSIIFRTQSRDGMDDRHAAMQADWGRRISRYFAFCVDGGWSRAHLTIRHLTQVASLSSEDQRDSVYFVSQEAVETIDRVIDFILCIVPAHMNKFVFTDNIVHKLRICRLENGEIDPNLSLNEWVMLRLLETNYLENLISRVSALEQVDQNDNESSYLMAYLLKALLTKTHDLELIRGVCQKITRLIVGRQHNFQSTELAVKPLLTPLINLVKRGNLYAKTYAMHALFALAYSDDGELIVKDASDPIQICVQIVRETKYPELLYATLKFLVAVYMSITKYVDDDENPVNKPDVVAMLVDMMGKRMNTTQRHAPLLLEQIAKLLTHLSTNEGARDIMLASHHDLVGKLMDIVKQHESYAGQMVVISKCIANIFIQAKDHESMFNHGIIAENGAEYCKVLSETLSDVTAKNKVRVALYAISVLRQLIRIDIPRKLAEKNARLYGADDKAVRAYNKDCERRFKILQTLATTDIAFDQVLKTVTVSSKRWKDESKKVDLGPMDETLTTAQLVIAREQRNRELLQEMAERRRDVAMIGEIVRWFRNMIRVAREQKWNYRAFEEFRKQNPTGIQQQPAPQ